MDLRQMWASSGLNFALNHRGQLSDKGANSLIKKIAVHSPDIVSDKVKSLRETADFLESCLRERGKKNG